MTPSASGQPAVIEAQGPWAAFRLLAAGRLGTGTQGAPDRATDRATDRAADRSALVFSKDGSTARFTLRANPNPFGHPLLAEFRCPAVQ